MKKILLLSLLVFGLFNVYSQTQITMTFTGKDSISQNNISLDSVHVKNLDENCDTLLYGPAPVLSLLANWPVGIGETGANSSGSFILKQNYPNPFQGSTSVSIYRENRGPLNLMLFDELGTKLAEYHNEFEKGYHSFVISSSGNKVLFLAVSDDINSRAIKIISTGQNNEGNTIRYLGQIQPVEKSSSLTPESPGFIFYLGNQMMYTAYASGYHNNTMFDDPTTSITYTFNMILSFTIGQSYGGGIIFYIDSTGQHGLISATNDQSTGATWGCWGTLIGTHTGIGTGQANTTLIVNGCSTPGIAARICDTLTLNGYSDWFLPSKDELNQMYIQKTVIGGFAPSGYWSSSEFDAYYAWVQFFDAGYQNWFSLKNGTAHVRAVRAF